MKGTGFYLTLLLGCLFYQAATNEEQSAVETRRLVHSPVAGNYRGGGYGYGSNGYGSRGYGGYGGYGYRGYGGYGGYAKYPYGYRGYGGYGSNGYGLHGYGGYGSSCYGSRGYGGYGSNGYGSRGYGGYGYGGYRRPSGLKLPSFSNGFGPYGDFFQASSFLRMFPYFNCYTKYSPFSYPGYSFGGGFPSFGKSFGFNNYYRGGVGYGKGYGFH